MLGLFQKYPTITTQELTNRLKGRITLLDVRSPQEYRAGHIAAAQNVPLPKLAAFESRIGREEPLYVICQSGIRSKRACSLLKKKGYQPVNVKGGMSRWQGALQRQ